MLHSRALSRGHSRDGTAGERAATAISSALQGGVLNRHEQLSGWVNRIPRFFPVPRLENPQPLPAGRDRGGCGAHSIGAGFQNGAMEATGNHPSSQQPGEMFPVLLGTPGADQVNPQGGKCATLV